jgi:nucleotide-binding universal stress UspA family protein
VKIKPMLARLESAMGCQDLIEQMLLLPEPRHQISDKEKQSKTINLVVGYSSSPRSQTALDLTLWIAHQTRLATQKQVTVQVVYVFDENLPPEVPNFFRFSDEENSLKEAKFLEGEPTHETSFATPLAVQTKNKWLTPTRRKTHSDRRNYKTKFSSSNPFEQADRILWQARCLAEEWRGSFKAHLRFGNLAEELRKVVEEENAELLFLGCDSSSHAIIQKLGKNFPCAVLGIPHNLNHEDPLASCTTKAKA